MLKPTTKAGAGGCLSDKDVQLLKKSFLKLTEIYYENSKNEASIRDLENLSSLITQVISTKREVDALSLISILEILKVKSKANPQLITCADSTIEHLRNPTPKAIQYDTLLYALQRSELFVVACTVGVRFY